MKKHALRDRTLRLRVSGVEEDLIRAKMAQIGSRNISAYLRKMAIDGYIVHLDFPELQKMTGLLGRCSNNLNQIARRANQTGKVSNDDLQSIREQQVQLIQLVNQMLTQFETLQ